MSDGDCPSDEDLFPLAIGESAESPVVAHVAECADCRERVRKLGLEMSTVRMLADGDASRQLAAVAADMQDVPPTIAKYFIVGKLAEDDELFTLRGMHAAVGVQVIVRTTRLPLAEGKTLEEPLLAECTRLARLRHPRLVPLRDAGVFLNRPYLVHDLVEGTSLERTPPESRPHGRAAIAFVTELAEAVASAHALDIAHGAIDAGHVVIDEAGHPHLTGFGVSLLRTLSHRTGSTVTEIPTASPHDDVAALGRLGQSLLPQTPDAEPATQACRRAANGEFATAVELHQTLAGSRTTTSPKWLLIGLAVAAALALALWFAFR